MRIFLCGVFTITAFVEYDLEKDFSFFSLIYICLAITYNPILKIGLNKDYWSVINILTILFIFLFIWKQKKI